MTEAIKGTYQEAVKSTIAAVSGALTTEDKWVAAGMHVRAYFGTETAIQEVKAQFTADAILPAMNKKHAAALAVELPRKGSKEYNALDQSGRDRWDIANQAKKDARSVAATMFNRIVSYAFPKDKAETAPRTLKTRLCEELAALIKACEKAEAPDFDVMAEIGHLKAALAVAAK